MIYDLSSSATLKDDLGARSVRASHAFDQLSMTLISTGSTLMFSFSSHLMAALMSGRRPSISRQTMPISSVTLAWRTLVMTGNFWLNFQITGVGINFGGNSNNELGSSGVR